VIPRRWIDDARASLNASTSQPEHMSEVAEAPAWRTRLRSRDGWSDASGYTISDLTMLRKELVIGFAVAGFASALVPVWFWRSLFTTGHGFWSSLENVVLGPFLALISFVCSIGNVPLAAALWRGGISFGGVVAFVFADLITLPLLVIYRKYFGIRLTLRLLAAFWVTMSCAGLATEYLFRAVGMVPTTSHHEVTVTHAGANYTTVLNVVAAIGFGVVYWLYRSGKQRRAEPTSPYAKDVVCGMQVEKASAPAHATVGSVSFFFCSDHCRSAFVTDPSKFGAAPAAAAHDHR